MRKEVLLSLITLVLVIITACEKIDNSELSDNNLQSMPQEIVACNTPYIKNASSCCLDANNNGVCDGDEAKKINNESQSGINPPVAETPAQPTKPKAAEAIAGKCSLPGGINCVDYKVNSTNVQVNLLNSLGYDARSVVVEAQTCGDSDVLSLNNGESKIFVIRCNYALTGSNYYGILSVQYTNAKTGISYYDSGQLNATIK